MAAQVDVVFMKLDKKTAVILALCLIALLALIYVASQGQQAQNSPGANANQVQSGNANSKTPQGNASSQPQGGEQQMPGNAPSQKPGDNITGGGTEKTPGGIAVGQNQLPWANLTNSTMNLTNSTYPTNLTNSTVIYPPDNTTIPPSANMSIDETDFMVVDDSLPSLLTSQKPTELPPPPDNSTR
jgi:hypothetical protein